MIRSMTGFGAASFHAEGGGFQLEIRSVNHRHLDVKVRVPRILSSLEPDLRARIQERFDRGKIDCTVSAAETGALEPTLQIDREAVRGYLEAARSLCDEEPGTHQASAREAARMTTVPCREDSGGA